MNRHQLAAPEKVHGTVKGLTYSNPENGYFVARVLIPGKGERTIVGTAPAIHPGEHIEATGSWKTSNWGPQFKATEVVLSAPKMLEGIEKYLSSAVEGIGKGYAKKLVSAFGESVFDVIEQTPEKLGEVPGIGPKRAKSIVTAYEEQKAIREIMVFLHRAGLSASRAKRVFDCYGDKAVARIKENPYVLCRDIWGIGFSTADEVALKQGIARDSEYRIRAGLQHVLQEAEGQGSCGLPVPTVRERASSLLGVAYERINECLGYELESQSIVKDMVGPDECLFRPRAYFAEKKIAEKLAAHSKAAPFTPIQDIDVAILHAELEIGITLEDVQREAVRVALGSQVCVITGGPGCGKTTITKVLLRVLHDEGLTNTVIAAPTGKAAKRSAEATGHEAKTIHRTLEVGPDGHFKRNEENPLEADALVIDEASMVDVQIMNSICKALSAQTRLIIVGDEDQLPSVGPGKVLADIIASKAVPTVRLRTIFRQAATSDIIKNAHAINRGEVPSTTWKEGSDFCFTTISPKDPKNEEDKRKAREQIEAELTRLVRDMYKLGFDPIRDVQVLAPMRKGLLGVESLNNRIQAILNPTPGACLELFGTKWGLDDKVMQLRNNYEKQVFNGDIGYICEIDSASKTFVVDFDGLKVSYKPSDLDELTLAYALTIHKSQGSEFPVVVMPIDTSHYTMLRRNLLYTGVTRSKKLCVLIGSPFAAKMAVSTAQNDERFTRLRYWLEEALPAPVRAALAESA